MEQAQQALPEVHVELFGSRHNLIPSFGTLCRFEKATGKNPLDLMTWANPTPTDLATLVWAALGGEKFGKSVDEVAEEMTGQHIATVKNLVETIFKKAELPEEVKNDEAA